MSYSWRGGFVGLQKIDEVSDTQKHEIGLCAEAFDPDYGYGTFIYLPGVASMIAGNTVVYDTYAGTTARTVAASKGPVAVAMAAITAGEWGWFQICGAAVLKTATVAANGMVYVTSTAGQTDDADVVNTQIDNAVFKTAVNTPATGFAVAQIAYPSANSQSED